jgi:transcriptional/translational regulatory protein YebC/TACO1
MRHYDFTLILSAVSELSDQLVEDLYEAGCDDGSPFSRGGVVAVTLHREADSLEQAIRSGIADVQKAGCRVARVEIEPDDFDEAGQATNIAAQGSAAKPQ